MGHRGLSPASACFLAAFLLKSARKSQSAVPMKSIHFSLRGHMLACILLCALTAPALAQGVAVNADGSPADNSALLDVKSTTKGVLVPRLTQAERNAIASPANGLLVYQTEAPAGFYFYNGSAWVAIGGAAGWALGGNAATATDFIGTTTDQPLRFRANNTEHARLTQKGALELGFGTFNNLFIGQGAGAATDLANNNVQTFPNTFIGHQAGQANTTGAANLFVGHQAGAANTTGSLNHFVGYGAGQANTTGGNNHFAGFQAGRANTTGRDNHFVGYRAGEANTTGGNNHFAGFQAGLNNTGGSFNHFVGNGAGFNNTTGSQNTFLGFQAGVANQTGSGNVFLGYQAGVSLVNPSDQLAIANNENTSLITGNFAAGQVGINTVAAPSAALDVQSTDKGVLVPRLTLLQRTGIASPADGLLVYQAEAPAGFYFYNGTAWVALATATSGWALGGNAATATDFIGTTTDQPLRFRANNTEQMVLAQRGALELGQQTFGNLFIGQGAGAVTDLSSSLVQANPNTFIGQQAGQANTNGRGNLFVGHQAGQNAMGSRNHFVGYRAGRNTTSGENQFIGYEAGRNNTTGNDNLFLGFRAGDGNTIGNNNQFLGFAAGFSNIGGDNNTFIGYEAGLTNREGSGNVFLGYQAGSTLNNPSDQLVIANNATTPLIRGDFANGQVFNQLNSTTWNTTSDRRIKQNVRPLEGALATLLRVRPVRYGFTPAWVAAHPSVGGREHYGVIAQEYREVFPDDVKPTADLLPGDPDPVLGVDMGSAQIVAIRAIQELAAEVEALKKENSVLKSKLGEMDEVKTKLNELYKLLQAAAPGGGK
jgi:hypothetical protein